MTNVIFFFFASRHFFYGFFEMFFFFRSFVSTPGSSNFVVVISQSRVFLAPQDCRPAFYSFSNPCWCLWAGATHRNRLPAHSTPSPHTRRVLFAHICSKVTSHLLQVLLIQVGSVVFSRFQRRPSF